METSSFNAPAAFVQEGDVGPLPRADATTLGAYLGNADLTALGDAAAAALAAAGEASPKPRSSLPGAASGEAEFLANLDNLVALSSKAGGRRLHSRQTPGQWNVEMKQLGYHQCIQ